MRKKDGKKIRTFASSASTPAVETTLAFSSSSSKMSGSASMFPWMILRRVLFVTRLRFLRVEEPALGLRGMTWRREQEMWRIAMAVRTAPPVTSSCLRSFKVRKIKIPSFPICDCFLAPLFIYYSVFLFSILLRFIAFVRLYVV